MINPQFDKFLMEEKIRKNTSKGLTIEKIYELLLEESQLHTMTILKAEQRLVELSDQIEYIKMNYLQKKDDE